MHRSTILYPPKGLFSERTQDHFTRGHKMSTDSMKNHFAHSLAGQSGAQIVKKIAEKGNGSLRQGILNIEKDACNMCATKMTTTGLKTSNSSHLNKLALGFSLISIAAPHIFQHLLKREIKKNVKVRIKRKDE